MGRPWRKASLRCSAAVFAVAVAVRVTSGIAVAAEASVFPGQLVGQWTHKVTAADVKRAGSNGIAAGSVWTLTVKTSGAARVITSGDPVFSGKIVPAGANRVHIKVGVLFPNVYTWRVSGRLLTFAKISESLADRAALFTGVWKRK